MTELTQDLSLAQARSLMDSYAFDLRSGSVERQLEYWLELYQANWIRLATIEALYLGRYKVISVEHILNVWLRIGMPNPHFTYEFERLICRQLPKHLNDLAESTAATSKPSATSLRQPEPNLAAQEPENSSVATMVQSDKEQAESDKEQAESDKERSLAHPSSSQSGMSIVSNWGLSYNPVWSDLTEGSRMIHQFIPLPDVSSFVAKLKTFGEERLEGQ